MYKPQFKNYNIEVVRYAFFRYCIDCSTKRRVRVLYSENKEHIPSSLWTAILEFATIPLLAIVAALGAGKTIILYLIAFVLIQSILIHIIHVDLYIKQHLNEFVEVDKTNSIIRRE